MDYLKVYNRLIQKRKKHLVTGYAEKHHILPKCLGGADDENNLVELTAREHFIAHLLIHKIYKCGKTAYALWMMQCKSPSFKGERNFIKNSRMYEWARNQFIKYFKGENKNFGEDNSQFGTFWICNLENKENKKVKKEEDIPNGWIKGRNKWKNVAESKKRPTQKRGDNGLTEAQNKCYESRRKQYRIDGKVFIGLKSICKEYNISHEVVLYRVKSKNFPTWDKIGEKH
jgi:hypothetical protein